MTKANDLAARFRHLIIAPMLSLEPN
jgi:hypothetical protein